MIEELNFLKAGTMAKSLSADVGLVTFRDGIASTYDGATSCRIPLDIGHDVSVRLFTLSRAVAVLGEGFAIKKMTANLQLSNDGVKIHVPFLVNNAEGYTASRGKKIDVPEGFAEAVRAVLPFSEVTPRDFTACVHISDGYALATSGNTVARYPLDTSFLEGRSLTIDAQSLSALVRMDLEKVSYSDSTFTGYEGERLLSVSLSACRFPCVKKLFGYDSGEPVDIDPATVAACRTASSLDSGSLPTLTFTDGLVSTGGESPDCSMAIQRGLGEGKYSSSKILAVLSKSEKIAMKSGEPSNFFAGKLQGVTIGMRAN